jgi:hypothetical protein
LKCKVILKTAVAHYEEYAHQYEKSVYEKVKKELISLLLNQLYLCFDQQLKMIRQSVIENFDKDIRKSSKRDQVNEQFAETTDRLYHEHFSSFKKQAADLIFEGSGWGEQVMIHESDVNQQMKSLISNSREKEIDKLQALT